jgi:17beta-estradiol 17-dehydrogenase / very-long-chain 3-oxoacyl-CoA reductase
LILNIGSIAGESSLPLYSVYSGSKAFVKSFTAGLSYECESKGVTVECHIPGYVVSKMSKVRKASFAVPSSSSFAKLVLSSVGLDRVHITYLPHALMVWVMQLIPEQIFIRYYLLGDLLSKRSRALRKK